MKKATAILCSDIHLRDDQPLAWGVDYGEAQLQALLFLQDLQKRHGCPVLCAGDLFHHWKPSPWLLTTAINSLPANLYAVAGQHDLPQHNIDMFSKSGMAVLVAAKRLQILSRLTEVLYEPPFIFEWMGISWGDTHSRPVWDCEWDRPRVLVMHKMVWKGKRPFPGCKAPSASKVMKWAGDCDLIVTGDNHKRFVVEKGKKILVNPGSLLPMTADQDKHVGGVYLWFAEDRSVEFVPVPLPKNPICKEYIETLSHLKKNTQQLKDLLNKINSMGNLKGPDFETNLRNLLSTAEVLDPETESLIWEAVDES